ncbi:MAG: glycosyltransferase family 2 protein [Clostridia bacterium]
MDIFKQIIDIVNWVFMGILVIGFLPQVLYIFISLKKLPQRPPAKKDHIFAIMLCAKDEAKVVGDTVQCMLRQNYPQDKFRVFVIADNCIDNTAEIARKNGAIVYERFDKEHIGRGWANSFGTSKILENYPDTEAFIMFDADNLAAFDYLKHMNDAFDDGVELAGGYANSKNFSMNIPADISGIYYMRSCRFSAHARELLGFNQNLATSGMLISSRILREKGYDAHGLCEDAEFIINRVLDGERAHYVEEAQYYAEQPSSLRETFKRNLRFGRGGSKLFATKGGSLLGHFFTTGKLTFLDLFVEYMFIPLALICTIWFPLFYGFWFINDIIMFSVQPQLLIGLAKNAAMGICIAFILPFVLQSIAVVLMEKKKLMHTTPKKLAPAMLLFPIYMIVYMVSIAAGTFNFHSKWKKINHSNTMTYKEFFGIKESGDGETIATDASSIEIVAEEVATETTAKKVTEEVAEEKIAIEKVTLQAQENE